MSDWTTIRVRRAVRDRLAAAAQVRGQTVSALLDKLSVKAADDALMDRTAERMRGLRDRDPDTWASYLLEADEWEAGIAERISS